MKYFAYLLLAVCLVGCGEKGPDPKVEQSRAQDAGQMRSIFDKAKGDYNSLSQADRDTFVKQAGGNEDNARRMWELMKNGGLNGPGGAGAPTGPGAPPTSGG